MRARKAPASLMLLRSLRTSLLLVFSIDWYANHPVFSFELPADLLADKRDELNVSSTSGSSGLRMMSVALVSPFRLIL